MRWQRSRQLHVLRHPAEFALGAQVIAEYERLGEAVKERLPMEAGAA